MAISWVSDPADPCRKFCAAAPATNLNETADLVARGRRRTGKAGAVLRAPGGRRGTRRRRPVAGIGRVLLWSGGSVWIGRDAGRVEPHAHHAIQVSLAMDSRLLLRDGDGGWREHRGAIVMPHRPHRFDGCGERRDALRRAGDRTGPGAARALPTARRLRPGRRHGGEAREPVARRLLAGATDDALIALGRDASPRGRKRAAAAASIRASPARSPGSASGSMRRCP